MEINLHPILEKDEIEWKEMKKLLEAISKEGWEIWFISPTCKEWEIKIKKE